MESESRPTPRTIWNWIDRFSGDKVILMVALFLMLISVISVFSSTPKLALETGTDRISIMMNQLVVVGIGVALMFVFYFFGKSSWYRSVSSLGFLFSFAVLLILVFNIDLGLVKAGEINGARRILKVFGKQFHVYEFVKVMMIMYLAWALDAFKNDELTLSGKIASWHPRLALVDSPFGRKCFYFYGPILLVTGMVMMGSNSSAIFLFLIMVLMLMVGGIDMKEVFAIGAVAVVILLLIFGAHKVGIIKKSRLDTAVSRVMDDKIQKLDSLDCYPQGSNDFNRLKDELNQPVGAMLAIQEGGLFGKGFGRSTQKYAVPVIFGDYIFSFIIEETGILGAIVIILLFFSLLARGTLVAKECDKYYDKILVSGLIILIVGQAFMHMAVNVHLPLVPQTGQTLPLVSHGTNSFLVFSMVFGILLSISKDARENMARREAEAAPIITRTEDDLRDSLNDLDNLESEQS